MSRNGWVNIRRCVTLLYDSRTRDVRRNLSRSLFSNCRLYIVSVPASREPRDRSCECTYAEIRN